MKRKTKLIAVLALTSLAAATLGACAAGGNPYPLLHSHGSDVKVRYDATGGSFGNGKIDIVDVLKSEDVEKGIARLLEPGSDVRGRTPAENSTVNRTGYNLIGWYSKRTPRVDASGNPLNDEGEPCEAEEQGYVYEGLWEFKDGYSVNKLTMPDLTEVTDEEGNTSYELTLYAAWAPGYTYDFYYEKSAGEWEKYGSYTQISQTLAVPNWNAGTGELTMGGVPKRENYSLTALYQDEAKTLPYAKDKLLTRTQETIVHTGVIDKERGTSSNMVMPVYTEWREGTWYRISTANQFASSFSATGSYEILKDLDFKNVSWPGSSVGFEGSIVGEGGVKKISNLTSTQSNSNVAGGMFGELKATASIRYITFENLTFNLGTATRQQGGLYGLLAGNISRDATVQNVTVSGTIRLGNLVKEHNFTNFTIGLLSGNLVTLGISTANIKVEVQQVSIGYDDSGNPNMGWPVTFEVLEDGTVHVSENADKSHNPNPASAE